MIGLFALAGMLLAACSSGDDEPTLSDEQPSDSTTTTAAPTETTSTTAAMPDEFTVGQTVETASGNPVTVYTYEQPVPPPDEFQVPSPSGEFAAIDVEECYEVETSGPTSPYGSFDFELIMADNTRRQPVPDVKMPPLSFGDLALGDCVRGWVSFEVAQGERAVEVTFTFTDVPIKWQVPAA